MVDWILEALFNTMDMGRGRFILVGNRIHKNSILANIAKVKGMHHVIVNAMDEKGKPTWHEKYTTKEIQDVIETIGIRRAQKEFYNNPVTDGAVSQLKDIQYKKALPYHTYNYLVSYTNHPLKMEHTMTFIKPLFCSAKQRKGVIIS